MKTLLKRLGANALSLAERITWRLRYWRMATHPGITLEGYCSISQTSRVEIVSGGSISIGKGTELMDGVLVLTYGGNIRIGRQCSINPYTVIYGHGNTTIGDNVLIAGGCMIIPSNHTFSRLDIPINQQGNTARGIVIEDNVWIGHGCSILDGVTIGEGSVVAAGSVVTRSTPPRVVVAGIPAKVVKNRNEEKY